VVLDEKEGTLADVQGACVRVCAALRLTQRLALRSSGPAGARAVHERLPALTAAAGSKKITAPFSVQFEQSHLVDRVLL
jgi:hypothetical protein